MQKYLRKKDCNAIIGAVVNCEEIIMKNSTKQKISFKASVILLKLFNEKLLNLPISKDLFLNNLIRTECERLACDLRGKRLSDEGKKIIAEHLKMMRYGTKQVSVVVDTEVAARLNEIVAKHNIVRDSFLNRILYFLLLTEPLRKLLQLPAEIDPISHHKISEKVCGGLLWETIPVSPIEWLTQVLADPFRYLREVRVNAVAEQGGGREEQEEAAKLYLIPMPEKLFGFTCYAEDSALPGTNLYKEMEEELNKEMKDF